jgi:hypothetical protein
MQRKRASTLLTTLSAVAVVSTLGLVLSRMCVAHLSLTTVKARRQEALDLARSAASLGLAKLSENADFQGQAVVPEGGWVVFDRPAAQRLGLPYSLNNLKGTRAEMGSLGSSVPPATAQLVAVGRSGGQTRRLEVVLAVPPFPFAVASSGPIRARRGVEIAGLRTLPLVGSLDSAPLGEADLVSNDPSAEAVFLGAGTRIRGSVQAVGHIAQDPHNVEVSGALKSQAERELIPHQDFSKYDPLAQGWDYNAIEVDQLAGGGPPLSGRRRKAGSLQVTDGLRLDGALLFVDGDLQVQGGLSGKGAVVVTGNVTLEGQSQFESGHAVAILSGGDTRIRGSGAQGSFFQGLVYTQGQFEADRVTLVGSLIANDERNRSPVELSQTRMWLSPHPVVRVELPTPGGPPPAGPLGPQLDRFTFNVFDRETGMGPTPVTVTLHQGAGGVWVDIGGGPQLMDADASQIMDYIIQSLGGYSWGPLFNKLQGALSSYDPQWVPPPTPPVPNPNILTFEPSSFLRLEERVRVVLWREDR